MPADREVTLLHRLGSGLEVCFRHLAEACASGAAKDPGDWWARYAAAVLNGWELREPTSCDRNQLLLPFARPHRLRASLFAAPGSGVGGRGQIDVLVQVWADTEFASYSHGTPLSFRVVDGARPIPPDVWRELREAAAAMAEWAPSARILLCGHPNPFAYEPPAVLRDEAIYALPPILLAGSKVPPRGMSGIRAGTLAWELASGSIGDPLLGGTRAESLDEFLVEFQVRHILRLHMMQPT